MLVLIVLGSTQHIGPITSAQYICSKVSRRGVASSKILLLLSQKHLIEIKEGRAFGQSSQGTDYGICWYLSGH